MRKRGARVEPDLNNSVAALGDAAGMTAATPYPQYSLQYARAQVTSASTALSMKDVAATSVTESPPFTISQAFGAPATRGPDSILLPSFSNQLKTTGSDVASPHGAASVSSIQYNLDVALKQPSSRSDQPDELDSKEGLGSKENLGSQQSLSFQIITSSDIPREADTRAESDALLTRYASTLTSQSVSPALNGNQLGASIELIPAGSVYQVSKRETPPEAIACGGSGVPEQASNGVEAKTKIPADSNPSTSLCQEQEDFSKASQSCIGEKQSQFSIEGNQMQDSKDLKHEVANESELADAAQSKNGTCVLDDPGAESNGMIASKGRLAYFEEVQSSRSDELSALATRTRGSSDNVPDVGTTSAEAPPETVNLSPSLRFKPTETQGKSDQEMNNSTRAESESDTDRSRRQKTPEDIASVQSLRDDPDENLVSEMEPSSIDIESRMYGVATLLLTDHSCEAAFETISSEQSLNQTTSDGGPAQAQLLPTPEPLPKDTSLRDPAEPIHPVGSPHNNADVLLEKGTLPAEFIGVAEQYSSHAHLEAVDHVSVQMPLDEVAAQQV